MTDKYSRVVDLLAQPTFENCKLKAYFDNAGIPTIGIGTIKYPDGTRVKMGDVCTKEQAEDWCLDHCKKFVFGAVDKLQSNYKFNDDVWVALCSLAYNIGSALSGQSILAALKNGNLNDLALAFRKYVLVNGEPSKGLKNRRENEIKIFLKENK